MIHTVINKYKNEEGSGLVLSLMVLLVLSVLGSALGIITVGSHKLADINRDSISAYYVAEAGANIAYEELKQGVMDTYRVSETADFFYTNSAGFKGVIDKVSEKNYSEEFSTQNGKQPIAEISIEGPMGSGDEREYIITSIGKIDGKTRVVDKVFELSYVPKNSGDTDLGILLPPNNAAIIVKKSFGIKSQSKVTGDVIGHSEGETDINNQDGVDFKKDDSYFEDNWDDTFNVKNLIEIPELNNSADLKKIGSISTDKPITITENSYLPNLVINGSTLTIDTDGKNIDLLVDKIDINGGVLNVIGEGSLRIFYNGSIPINLQNSSRLNATIISKQASINGSALVVTGDIIAGAPIDLSNKPNVTGTIISTKSITADNATIVGNIVSGEVIELRNNETKIRGNIASKGKIKFDNAEIYGLLVSENNIEVGNESKISSLLFAPKGKVTIGSGAIVTGSVIAKEVSLPDRGNVNFSNIFNDYIQKGESGSEPVNIEDLISSSPAIEK